MTGGRRFAPAAIETVSTIALTQPISRIEEAIDRLGKL